MFGKSKDIRHENEVEIQNKYNRLTGVSEEEKRYSNVANRGCVYEFLEKDGQIKNYVLVISGQQRATDKLITILMLGDSPAGADVVKIDFKGESKYIHCGMMTYCARVKLGHCVMTLDDYLMNRIDKELAKQLGLVADDSHYKELYDNLLDKIVAGYKETL